MRRRIRDWWYDNDSPVGTVKSAPSGLVVLVAVDAHAQFALLRGSLSNNEMRAVLKAMDEVSERLQVGDTSESILKLYSERVCELAGWDYDREVAS